MPVTPIVGTPTPSPVVSGLGPPTAGAASGGTPTVEGQTYQFVAGWVLLFILLIFINKSRVGHVLIYYSLLLMILLIVVTEYAQIAPLLNSVQSIGQFDASLALGTPTAGAASGSATSNNPANTQTYHKIG
jgi:hypothetical protein